MLDIFIFSKQATIASISQSLPISSSQVCPAACISEIHSTVAWLPIATPSGQTCQTTCPSVATQPSQNVISNAVREFFIPFGIGMTQAIDWQDIAGLSAYIDSSKYTSVKSIVFEASVHLPAGDQSVGIRLYDETNKHPVWNSEVDFPGGANPQFLVSKPISLSNGNVLYNVQMKTQLAAPAMLDQSRVHIITN